MSRSILNFLDCLNCFRQKRSDFIIGTPLSYSDESEGSNEKSRSAGSLEKDSSKFNKENITVETHARPQTAKAPPRSNPALLVVGKGQYEIRESYPFPSLSHDKEVVIQTKAVGLNPIDWKSVEYGFCLPEFPWITGREMAGIVEEVGSGVVNLKPGQRVWTSRPSTN